MRALAALLAVLLAVAPASAGQIVNPQNNLCTIPAGGVITTAVGNVGGGEDDLMTYSLPANALAVNGSYLEIEAWTTTAANGNTKTGTLYFGATALQSRAVALNAGSLSFFARVIRTSATAQEAVSRGSHSDGVAGSSRTTPAETLTGAVTIKMTGESASSATDDIVQRGMIVKVCNP